MACISYSLSHGKSIVHFVLTTWNLTLSWLYSLLNLKFDLVVLLVRKFHVSAHTLSYQCIAYWPALITCAVYEIWPHPTASKCNYINQHNHCCSFQYNGKRDLTLYYIYLHFLFNIIASCKWSSSANLMINLFLSRVFYNWKTVLRWISMANFIW